MSEADRFREGMRRQQDAIGPAMDRTAEKFVERLMQGHQDLVTILEHPELAELNARTRKTGSTENDP